MVPEDWEKAIAAERAWVAGQGNRLAAEGILHCWNRQVLNSGKTWTEVFYDCDLSGPDPDPKDPEFQQLLSVVDLIYANQRKDRFTNGGEIFNQTPDLGDDWLLTATLGTTFFYRRKQ